MHNLTENNIWSTYCPVYARITPEVHRELLAYCAGWAQGSVLDAGVGTGKLFDYLVGNDNVSHCLGIDSNVEMIVEANKKLSQMSDNRFEARCDMVEWLEEKWDTIISINVLYAVDDPLVYLRNIYDCLVSKGRLIISSPLTSIDMKELVRIVDREFPPGCPEFDGYQLFKECNWYLTSGDFKPRFYEVNEITSLLMAVGFDLIDLKTSHFEKGNFTLILQKRE